MVMWGEGRISTTGLSPLPRGSKLSYGGSRTPDRVSTKHSAVGYTAWLPGQQMQHCRCHDPVNSASLRWFQGRHQPGRCLQQELNTGDEVTTNPEPTDFYSSVATPFPQGLAALFLPDRTKVPVFLVERMVFSVLLAE
ncbi:hypothetical protein NDU88_010295 [Pleurodeles waltl]|uniref:Uncharacterized protein n=1 Tax=Pleurodeles waltl TaxID=8319 RepID=A0AAV7QV97_PLEWA|nr:hypothetical protein NDU88_010295 [Pleurodeles waltl]